MMATNDVVHLPCLKAGNCLLTDWHTSEALYRFCHPKVTKEQHEEGGGSSEALQELPNLELPGALF